MRCLGKMTIVVVLVLPLLGPTASAHERFSMAETVQQIPSERLSLLIDPVGRYSQEGNEVALTLALTTDSGAEFSIEGLPPGLAFNPATGVILGVLGQDSAGKYLVTASARTGALTETISFSWFVLEDDSPWVEDPGVVLSAAGDTVDMPLAIRFEQNGAESLAIKALNLPPGLTLSQDGVISGTIRPHDHMVSYQVTIHAVHYTDAATSRLPTWGGTIFTWIVQPGTR